MGLNGGTALPPERIRRPSGAGLPSGYDPVEDAWFQEPRWAVGAFLAHETFTGPIIDPCCGGGNIVAVCRDHGLIAIGSDLVDRGFGQVRNAFDLRGPLRDVITNPPFCHAEPLVRHLLPITQGKLACLLRLAFLESQGRAAFFDEFPPIRVWVSTQRISAPPGDPNCLRDRHGALIPSPASGGSMAYAWFLWQRGYRGPTTLRWLRPVTASPGVKKEAT